MIKKVKTIFFLIVAILFLLAIPVSAREMDINELGTKALELKPGINYVYVIGEHAFTSSHILTTQDVMLAARTISTQNEYDGKNEKQALNEMAIHMITPTTKIENKKIVVTGWNKGKDILGGNTTLKDKVNVNYIDYNYIPEDTVASVSLDLKDQKYTNALTNLTFAGGNEKNSESLAIDGNGNLTGLVLKNNDVTSYPEQYLTGYYFAYTLKVKGADSKTTVKINHKGSKLQKDLTYSNFDIQADGDAEDEMVVLVALNDKANPEDKVIEIVVDRDGDEIKYAPKTLTINYKDLTYQQDSEAKIKSDELPVPDVESIATSWGYTKTIQDTYKLKVDDKDPFKFNLSGIVVKQDVKAEAGLGTDGYFVLYNINDDKFIPNTTTIVVPVNEGSGTEIKTIGSDGNGLTILHKLNKEALKREFNLVIDIDGPGNKYAPVTYTINYDGVEFGEPSKISIVPEENAFDVSEIKESLSNKFKWEKPENWDVKLNTVQTEDETVFKLSAEGMLPIMESVIGFSGDTKTNYYLPVVIKSSVAPTEQTKLIIPNVSSASGKKEVIGTNAWDKKSGEDNEIVILMSLKPEEVQAMALEKAARTFDIIIDLDGDKSTKYLPYTITVDYSNLKFQQKSNTSMELGSQTETEEQFKSWGYNPSVNQDLKLENGLLSGTLRAQKLDSAEAFGEQNRDGYYFEFKIDIPEGLDYSKVKIDRLDGKNGGIKKNFPSSDFENKGYLPILFRFNPDKVRCEKCNSSSATCSCSKAEECECEDYKLYYRVDFDGNESDEYLPQDYVIDYCKLTFEKASTFTVAALAKNEANKFQTNGDKNWYDEANGYSAEVNKDGELKYKVKGILPIFDDSQGWKDQSSFDTSKNLYYLGLVLDLNNISKNQDKLDVKTLKGEEEDTQFAKVVEGNKVYILKAFEDAKIPDAQKVFDIVVDFDGKDNNEYSPYTVTIDWSELKLQKVSSGNTNNYSLIKMSELGKETPEYKELDGYKFNEEANTEVKIDGNGISGKIKEQDLDNGFKDNNGYFVPIKIEYPGTDEAYKKTWTLIINEEGGGTKKYTPKDAEYTQGWVQVLFKLNKDDGSKKITYKIDFDGDENAFVPQEYTINYEGLEFLTKNKITFEYFDETTGTKQTSEKIVYQGEVIDKSIAPQLGQYTYHAFDYWYEYDEQGTNADKEFGFGSDSTEANEDITLKAHWTLDIDKFLTDVVNDLANSESEITSNYSDIFKVSKAENTITFNIKNSTTKLSEMNNTSIPGAIAYILQRGEVKDITLGSGNSKVAFTKTGENNEVQTVSLDEEGTTLKGKIQAGAKKLFETVLGSTQNAEDMTLNKMAVEDKNFTITVGELDKSVKLTDGANKEYTFKFETEVAAVKDEGELTSALNNDKIKYIDIIEDFNASSSHKITRPLTINGNPDSSTMHSITASSNNNNIFTVASNDVVINNVELKDSGAPIVVESGKLTTTGLKITGLKVAEEGTTVAAIDVKDNASLEASQLTFDEETYNKPSVKAGLTGTNVKLTGSNSKTASRVEKEKITLYENIDGDKNNVYGDKKEKENIYTYYNKEENSKIYTTVFYNHEGGSRIDFTRYNIYGETIKTPPTDEERYKYFKDFTYDSHTYKLLGYTASRQDAVFTDERLDSLGKDEQNLPEGVIKKEDLQAKSDVHYWLSFKVSIINGGKEVKDYQTFKSAIEDPAVKNIFITDNSTIDAEDNIINIDHDVTIIGAMKASTRIKAKQINITGGNVFIQRLSLDMNPQEETENFITVSNEAKLTIWDLYVKNVGSNDIKNVIKYEGSTAVVDIRYTLFYNNQTNKITQSYLDIESPLAEGTDIYLNSFNTIEGGEQENKSAIIIKTFDESAVTLDGETDIRISGNDFKDNKYAIKILKDASGKKADIVLDSVYNTKIAVMYNDSQNQFENIKIQQTGKGVFTVKYINELNESVTDAPTAGKGLTINSKTTSGDAGALAPDSISIDGLEKNGSTYSGIVNQSEDNKFYLPVTLTSSNFKDNVSTIKITNPNGNTENRTYTTTSGSENTMKLSLEAIKSNKITNDDGKVYKLEFDADGPDSNYIEVKSYTIDYNGVQTLEELINNAAKNTREANNMTITKNNYIKGNPEDFTYEYDREKDLTLYNHNGEYSFRYRNVVPSHKGQIIIVVRKPEGGSSKPKLNENWEFSNFLSKASMGSHEISLLEDVMAQTPIDAIHKVKRIEGHKFEVTLNKEKINNWLNNAYLDGATAEEKKDTAEAEEDTNIIFTVVLDDSETHLVSIKTPDEGFKIVTKQGVPYDTNRISVEYSNIGTTTIEEPSTFLSEDGKAITQSEFETFYDACKLYHKQQTGADIYEGE